jgi:hypothetical protein
MLLQVLTVAREQGSPLAAGLDAAVERAGVTPRSSTTSATRPSTAGCHPTCRFGAVRAALTAVIRPGLVHLGLPATDPIWLVPPAPWTQLRLWSGGDVPRDEALEPHLQRPGLSGLRRRARQSGGRLLRRLRSG